MPPKSLRAVIDGAIDTDLQREYARHKASLKNVIDAESMTLFVFKMNDNRQRPRFALFALDLVVYACEQSHVKQSQATSIEKREISASKCMVMCEMLLEAAYDDYIHNRSNVASEQEDTALANMYIEGMLALERALRRIEDKHSSSENPCAYVMRNVSMRIREAILNYKE